MEMDRLVYERLARQYGEPFGGRGFNQPFFAALLLETRQLRFSGKQHLAFDGKAWSPVSGTTITQWTFETLREFFSVMDRSELLGRITETLLVSIGKMAQTIGNRPSFPAMDWHLVPCQNTVLRWDDTAREFIPEGFFPDQNIRSLLTVDYDPEADYGEFKQTVLDEVLSQDDQLLVQRYLGTALMPVNLTQNFLLLQGVGGSSKSLLVRLLVEILGDQRVFDLDIKEAGRDYALSGLSTQTLITASESAGDALCSSGAPHIKKMVGGDKIQTRMKYLNEKRQLCGTYSLIIVTNEYAAFQYTGRGQEWQRRLLPEFFDKQHVKTEKGLLERLMKDHASGILNWLLAGAADVLRNNWTIPLSAVQEIRRDRLISRSEPVRAFVERCVKRSVGDDFTSDEAHRCYAEIANKEMWPLLSREAFFKKLAFSMAERFPGAVGNNNLCRSDRGRSSRTCRGYRGYKLGRLGGHE